MKIKLNSTYTKNDWKRYGKKESARILKELTATKSLYTGMVKKELMSDVLSKKGKKYYEKWEGYLGFFAQWYIMWWGGWIMINQRLQSMTKQGSRQHQEQIYIQTTFILPGDDGCGEFMRQQAENSSDEYDDLFDCFNTFSFLQIMVIFMGRTAPSM